MKVGGVDRGFYTVVVSIRLDKPRSRRKSDSSNVKNVSGKIGRGGVEEDRKTLDGLPTLVAAAEKRTRDGPSSSQIFFKRGSTGAWLSKDEWWFLQSEEAKSWSIRQWFVDLQQYWQFSWWRVYAFLVWCYESPWRLDLCGFSERRSDFSCPLRGGVWGSCCISGRIRKFRCAGLWCNHFFWVALEIAEALFSKIHENDTRFPGVDPFSGRSFILGDNASWKATSLSRRPIRNDALGGFWIPVHLFSDQPKPTSWMLGINFLKEHRWVVNYGADLIQFPMQSHCCRPLFVSSRDLYSTPLYGQHWEPPLQTQWLMNLPQRTIVILTCIHQTMSTWIGMNEPSDEQISESLDSCTERSLMSQR